MPKLLEIRVSNTMSRAGNASVSVPAAAPRIVCNIEIPITISAGAVASFGMTSTSGVRNNIAAKQAPATTAVKPVRPPASAPAADSMSAVSAGDAGKRSNSRGNGVYDECPFNAGQIPLLIRQPGLGSNGQRGAQGREELSREKRRTGMAEPAR